jgi:hypothetical protein
MRLEKVLPSGWSMNMLLVRLRDGGLLVHSPTWLGDDTFARVDQIGPVRALFAPNHYHHLSLARFRERYPDAMAIASEAAIPRLTKKGHARLLELEEAARLLPPGASFLRCEGTKSGEAWLSLPGDSGPTWIVCDAFFHLTRNVAGMTGIALRTLQVTPGLTISKTYRWLALRDVVRYRAFALETIEREAPRRLVVSHGDAIDSPDLPARLAELVRAKL